MTSKEIQKNTGATFTPRKLANFLSDRILKYIDKGQVQVLDPACGDGELLLSIGEKLEKNQFKFSLIGQDTNNEYLETAKLRISNLTCSNSKFISGDFLNFVQMDNKSQLSIFTNEIQEEKNCVLSDIVIANPPYVRTQIIGPNRAQELAKKFNLKGKVDLYFAFLIAMTASLREGGILGVITSNRYLTTKSGESVREFLKQNYDILEVIDLGDTKLFNAAVLPAIFIGKKKTSKSLHSQGRFEKIYESLDLIDTNQIEDVDSIFEVLENEKAGHFRIGEKHYVKTIGSLNSDTGKGNVWGMLSKDETEWTSIIEKNASCFAGDIFKVRVGIKTTADSVFIKEDWDKLGDIKPENELLLDLLSQENLKAWKSTTNSSLKVLYTHYVENGKRKVIDLDNFPRAKSYLSLHREKLQSREYVIKAKRKWYEIWVPQNPDAWKLPKLVFPDISPLPRFYFDEGGKAVNGNCYWIAAKTKAEVNNLLLLQGCANSKLMTKYHDAVFNNKLYSGRRRYISQYIEKYPLPNPNIPASKAIVEVVRKLNAGVNEALKLNLEEDLELLVAKAFNLID